MRLGLRRTVLAGDALPFGDGEGLRWLSLRVEGEEGYDESGRAVEEEEGALIERLFTASESETSFLFIDGGNGEGEGGSFTKLLEGGSAIMLKGQQSPRPSANARVDTESCWMQFAQVWFGVKFEM